MHAIKVFLILVLLSSLSFAQQDSLTVKYDDTPLHVQQITEDDLESYKNDEAFNYNEDVADNTIIDNIKRWLRNVIQRVLEALFGVGNVGGILYFIFNIVPYIILAILLFFLVKFFLKVNSRSIISGKQKSATVKFTEDEHIIKNEDINALILEAIAQQNFRLAIRYYYLLSLKSLTDKELILWQQQKTNTDYISEIETATLKTDFKAITKIYDYVWYGEFEIDEIKFESLKTAFHKLDKTILKS
ncbi:DUF4129 domain-containing protein [Lacinutrix undariae]